MLPALLGSLLSGIGIAVWLVTHESGHASSDRLAQIGDWLGLAMLVIVFAGCLLTLVTLLAVHRASKRAEDGDESRSS